MNDLAYTVNNIIIELEELKQIVKWLEEVVKMLGINKADR